MTQERRAIVIGAGIGGLATAIGLRRSGWQVQVYEQAGSAHPVGAGISLWSNALRALEWLGVAQAIRDRGAVRTGGGVRSPSGRWLSRTLADALIASDDVTMLMVHRADLHEALLAALPHDVVRFGARLERVEEAAAAVTVQLATDGGPTTDEAALLVAADGLRSVVRRQLWSPGFGPRYAGFTAWRGVTERPFTLVEQSQTLGRAAEVGLVQLQDGRVYWFATGDDLEGIRHADERAEVLRRFGSWHAPIRDVVEATRRQHVLRHDLFRLPRPYPSFVRGRVALLGDAAHAMLPTLGQGGCLALEDAVVLSDAVAHHGEVPTALTVYDGERRPRDQRMSASSDRMAKITQLRNPVVLPLRDLALRLTPPAVAARTLARATSWHPPA
jgi:2-polyprenyl-6-methoxyphenol hydroxylase-like FAD-dependent oxidoreductase